MALPRRPERYNFNIAVTDSLGGQTVVPFQVTFATVVSQLQVTPLSLTFNANLNGNPPPTQAIAVVPATGATPPVNYHVVIDNGQNGQNNTVGASWITVTPTSGVAPVGLVVSVDQGNMAAGSYPARIRVLDGNRSRHRRCRYTQRRECGSAIDGGSSDIEFHGPLRDARQSDRGTDGIE